MKYLALFFLLLGLAGLGFLFYAVVETADMKQATIFAGMHPAKLAVVSLFGTTVSLVLCGACAADIK